MRKTGAILLPALLVAMAGAIHAATLSASQSGKPAVADIADKSAPAPELVARGKQLRAAIDRKLEALEQAGQVKPGSANRNEFRDTVLAYIPVGCTFDEAEAILRSAGFSVNPRGEILPGIRKDDYGTLANIDPYKAALFQKTWISVVLRPASPTDWSHVSEVETEIGIQTL